MLDKTGRAYLEAGTRSTTRRNSSSDSPSNCVQAEDRMTAPPQVAVVGGRPTAPGAFGAVMLLRRRRHPESSSAAPSHLDMLSAARRPKLAALRRCVPARTRATAAIDAEVADRRSSLAVVASAKRKLEDALTLIGRADHRSLRRPPPRRRAPRTARQRRLLAGERRRPPRTIPPPTAASRPGSDASRKCGGRLRPLRRCSGRMTCTSAEGPRYDFSTQYKASADSPPAEPSCRRRPGRVPRARRQPARVLLSDLVRAGLVPRHRWRTLHPSPPADSLQQTTPTTCAYSIV